MKKLISPKSYPLEHANNPPIFEHKGVALKFLGAGRHRFTYLLPSGKYVIKVPGNPDGEKANREEAKFAQQGYFHPIAKCRLINYGQLPCLIMEAVDTHAPFKMDQLPKWTDDVDNLQIGVSRKRGLVAYDFSDI